MELKQQEQIEALVKRISELETAPVPKGRVFAENELQEQVYTLTKQNTELDTTAKTEQRKRILLEQKLKSTNEEKVRVFNTLMSKATNGKPISDLSSLIPDSSVSQPPYPESSAPSVGQALSSQTERPLRPKPSSVNGQSIGAQMALTPANNEIVNERRRALNEPLNVLLAAENGVLDQRTSSDSVFRPVPLPDNQLSEDGPEIGLQVAPNQGHRAPIIRPEKIIVPLFDGTKGTFEHWIRNVDYHIDQSQLLNGTDSSLCQFLITHLKPGSAPEMIISSRRKTLKSENKPPNSFIA